MVGVAECVAPADEVVAPRELQGLCLGAVACATRARLRYSTN